MRLEAVAKLGWEARCLDPETGWLWLLTKGERRHVMTGPLAAVNSASASRLASDKHHSATVLADAGIRVPAGTRCLRLDAFLGQPGQPDRFASQRGIESAERFVAGRGYPVVVKPNRGSQGRFVQVVDRAETLREAVEGAWTMDTLALVQELVPGLDLRVDVLDGELLVAYLRRPFSLVGDGHSSVRELLAAVEARARIPAFMAKLGRDPLWRQTLDAAGLDEDTVAPAGLALEFAASILNLNRCCTAEVHTQLPTAWVSHAAHVARLIGLRHAGVDFRVPAGCDPLSMDPTRAVVLEVNASPSVTQISRMGAVEFESARQAEHRVVEAALAGPLS